MPMQPVAARWGSRRAGCCRMCTPWGPGCSCTARRRSRPLQFVSTLSRWTASTLAVLGAPHRVHKAGRPRRHAGADVHFHVLRRPRPHPQQGHVRNKYVFLLFSILALKLTLLLLYRYAKWNKHTINGKVEDVVALADGILLQCTPASTPRCARTGVLPSKFPKFRCPTPGNGFCFTRVSCRKKKKREE